MRRLVPRLVSGEGGHRRAPVPPKSAVSLSALEGIGGEGTAVRGAELAQQGRDVALHGANGDKEPPGDLGIGEPLAKQL
jgi:hypothetical protein